MQLAIAMFALATSAVPSGGLLTSFASDLRLTLGDIDNGPPPGSAYPPPPPLVETPTPPPTAPPQTPPGFYEPPAEQPDPAPASTAFPPPPLHHVPRILEVPEPPPTEAGSVSVAFWESYAADLGLRLVFESVAGFSIVVAAFAFSPPCGGQGNPTEGAVFLILGIAALVGQPFAMAGVVGAIFHGQDRHPNYWTSFAYDVFFTLIVAPLAGFLFGELGNVVSGGSNNTTPEVALGITAFGLAGAFGAPAGAYASLPSPPLAQPAVPVPHAAIGIPLVHLAFN